MCGLDNGPAEIYTPCDASAKLDLIKLSTNCTGRDINVVELFLIIIFNIRRRFKNRVSKWSFKILEMSQSSLSVVARLRCFLDFFWTRPCSRICFKEFNALQTDHTRKLTICFWRILSLNLRFMSRRSSGVQWILRPILKDSKEIILKKILKQLLVINFTYQTEIELYFKWSEKVLNSEQHKRSYMHSRKAH